LPETSTSATSSRWSAGRVATKKSPANAVPPADSMALSAYQPGDAQLGTPQRGAEHDEAHQDLDRGRSVGPRGRVLLPEDGDEQQGQDEHDERTQPPRP
jgi:hypothetical protein